MIRHLLAASGVVWCFASSSLAQSQTFALEAGCREGETCTVELPGATCGDGTPMFINVTLKPHAPKLYLYLQGGGACWDAVTCGCGFDGVCSGGTASSLTRPDPAQVRSGWHRSDQVASLLGDDYSLVEVPYCTGDLFMGGRVQNFGTEEWPLLVHQVGYDNMRIALAKVKELIPDPSSVVFMGTSAGGLGATFNLHQVQRTYPHAALAVISDSGTPFKQPFVWQASLDAVTNAWGVRANLPEDYAAMVPGPLDFAGVLHYNALKFPNHRYALISAYDDSVMTAFSMILGTSYGLLTVRNLLGDVASHALGDQQKVFYLAGSRHTFHELAVDSVVSNGIELGRWLRQMLSGDAEWTSVQPAL